MKKSRIPIYIFIALAATAAASLAQAPSPAKAGAPAPTAAPAPAASAVPGHDPFVKKQDEPRDAGQPINICFTVEVYALAQPDAEKLVEENPDGEARHARMLELAGSGKARLETLLSDVTKSGQRTVVEQNDEVRYPTEYESSQVQGEPAWPTAYEDRNVGETMEFEPVLSRDNSVCDINMVLSSVRFQGFMDYSARDQDAPVAQPVFESRKFTTSMMLIPGKNQFLGTLSAPPQFVAAGAGAAVPQEVRLVFGRIGLVMITPPDGPLPAMAERATLEHRLVFYSLDREAARQILAGEPKPGAYYGAVLALVEKQQARLERVTVLKTNSGQRAVVEEVHEIRYPTEYSLTHGGDDEPAKKGTSSTSKPQATSHPVEKPAGGFAYEPSAFETRNAGLTLEIEPVAGKSIVDLNLAPQLVNNLGSLQVKGVAQKYPEQPVFETNKITTSLSALPGEYAFIGTFSPPGDTGVNGRKDTGRVWFAFIWSAPAKQ